MLICFVFRRDSSTGSSWLSSTTKNRIFRLNEANNYNYCHHSFSKKENETWFVSHRPWFSCYVFFFLFDVSRCSGLEQKWIKFSSIQKRQKKIGSEHRLRLDFATYGTEYQFPANWCWMAAHFVRKLSIRQNRRANGNVLTISTAHSTDTRCVPDTRSSVGIAFQFGVLLWTGIFLHARVHRPCWTRRNK